MKYSFIICLLVTIFSSFAYADGQGVLDKKINLNIKDELLKDALHQITETDGINIIFTGNEVVNTQRVSLSANGLSLKTVLSRLLSPYSLTYKVVDDNIVVKRALVITPHKAAKMLDTVPETPKSLTITGKVQDAIGNALGGVTVLVKGSTHGTLTNSVGYYTINANSNDSIVFSEVGYESQTWSAKNRVTLNIVLEAQENSLNEVVVSGYGQAQTSVSVTGAISTVRTAELKQSPVANLTNALAGRLPGLTAMQSSGLPGSDASTLYIRGVSTYSGTQTPLVVIDGLPLGDANFGDLDVNEIESISILKDAASTSLYGIQGANGVILVTTKRGKIGKPSIQLNGQYSEQHPTRLPVYLDAYRSALLDNEGAANDGLGQIWSDAALNAMKNKTDPYTYPDVDWYNVILNSEAPESQFNVNITGGNDEVTYFVSGSYLHQGTLLKNASNNKYGVSDKYDRYNFRSNINVNVTKTLKLRLDLASNLQDRQGPGSGYDAIFGMLSEYSNTTTPIFNPDGSYAAGNTMTTGWNNILGLEQASGYYQNYWTTTNGTVEATQNFDFITPGLSAKAMFTFQNYGEIDQSETQGFNSYRFSQDPTTGVQTYRLFTQATSLTSGYSTSANRYYYYDVEINYNRKFGKSTVGGMLLGNRTYTSVANDLPHVYQGLVGQTTYNYDNRYFAEFNFGYNGSENFPPGKRYGFFPAISGGWVISDENFFKDNIKFMNYLKLRGSYGIVGNDQIGSDRWLFLSTYGPTTGAVFGTSPAQSSGYAETALGNENVTWEKSHKADIGLEMGFVKNAIKLTADYFHELRTNILTQPATLPDYLGITSAKPINLGKVVNRGIELDLKLNTYAGKVNIFADLNYSLAKNKILFADEPQLPYAYQYEKGHPIGYTLGYVAEGLFQSQDEINQSAKQPFAPNGAPIPGDIKYKDMNGDGVIDESDRVMIPNRNFPTQIFGGSIGFGIAGFDFSVLLQGALGGEANYSGYLIGTGSNLYQYRPYEYDNRWTAATAATAKYPAIHQNRSNNDVTSTFWLYSTNYLKLRNFEVGYALPYNWVKRLHFTKIRVFVNGQNLFTWDKLPLKDVDPEIDPQGGVGVPYPIQRIFNAGATINF